MTILNKVHIIKIIQSGNVESFSSLCKLPFDFIKEEKQLPTKVELKYLWDMYK
ncbi:hypothetical protein [Vallitalea guaymasensis]|uniref:hypothetical protein n=1 Tax=Vallitalea guaymasensis TaxID=1185412 RepID=UPI00187D4375|nr:hypothetical protein [Vallitalea guaymasensis]